MKLWMLLAALCLLPCMASAATNTLRPLGSPYSGNGYIEYLPSSYSQRTKSPLIVFLHGIDQNGNGTSDLSNVADWGPPQIIADNLWPTSRPFVVLSPQHSGYDCPSANEIHNFINFAVSHYNVDKNRVYLTGLSCGALGMDMYLATYGSSQVAAAVPVAGDALPTWNAQGCSLVQNVAVWAFHSGLDQSVPIAGDNSALPNFAGCANRKDVEYTVYPTGDHGTTWVRAYDPSYGADIYNWMLQFSRQF